MARVPLPLPLVALAVSWLSLSPAGASAPPLPGAGASLPALVLWAWERPTDLRGLDAGVGVAFLAQTITLGGGAVDARPRRNPLHVSPATPLVAVTRIEHPPSEAPALDDRAVSRVADLVVRSTTWPQVVAAQIDFDAAASERDLYRRLLVEIRARLGPDVPVSVTALASWCVGDRWLDGLPVDEAVPMLFRLGPLNAPYTDIATSPSSAAPECRGAVGTSLDEPLAVRAGARRVYVFNPRAWTASTVALARQVGE